MDVPRVTDAERAEALAIAAEAREAIDAERMVEAIMGEDGFDVDPEDDAR